MISGFGNLRKIIRTQDKAVKAGIIGANLKVILQLSYRVEKQ